MPSTRTHDGLRDRRALVERGRAVEHVDAVEPQAADLEVSVVQVVELEAGVLGLMDEKGEA